MDNELLVKSIRGLCKKNGISVSQLESELKFGAGLISRWSKNSPSIDKIVAIADYFEISIDETIGRVINVKSKTTEDFIDKLYNMTTANCIKWEDETNKVPEMQEYDNSSIEDDGYEYFELYTVKYNDGIIYLYAQYDKEKGIINDINIQLYIQANKQAELVLQECDEAKSYDLWYYIQAQFNGELDEIQAEKFKSDFINGTVKNSINIYSDEQLKQITKNMIEMEPQLPKLFEAITNPEFKALIDALKSPKLQQGLELAQRLSVYYSLIDHDTEHNIKKTP